MHTITVLFRLESDHCKVAIGSVDPDLGSPVWFTMDPIVGPHTQNEWEELVRPHVVRFAKRLGIEGLHGGRIVYSGQIHSMMEFDFDSPDFAHHGMVLGDEFNAEEEVPHVENWYPADAN